MQFCLTIICCSLPIRNPRDINALLVFLPSLFLTLQRPNSVFMIVLFSALYPAKNTSPSCNCLIQLVFLDWLIMDNAVHTYKKKENIKHSLQYIFKYHMAEQVNFVCLWRTQVCSVIADDLFHQMGMRCLSSWYPSPCENHTAYSKLLLLVFSNISIAFLHIKRRFNGFIFIS